MRGSSFKTSIRKGANITAPPIPASMAIVAMIIATGNINQKLVSIILTTMSGKVILVLLAHYLLSVPQIIIGAKWDGAAVRQ